MLLLESQQRLSTLHSREANLRSPDCMTHPAHHTAVLLSGLISYGYQVDIAGQVYESSPMMKAKEAMGCACTGMKFILQDRPPELKISQG
ncbi:UNVERIFIED_CONTAM: hypothetical protein FKN15_055922 [Acipenser sinensis]